MKLALTLFVLSLFSFSSFAQTDTSAPASDQDHNALLANPPKSEQATEMKEVKIKKSHKKVKHVKAKKHHTKKKHKKHKNR